MPGKGVTGKGNFGPIFWPLAPKTALSYRVMHREAASSADAVSFCMGIFSYVRLLFAIVSALM
jgi:hypothetical protein